MISVLYVDDEPDLLNLGKRFMENSGDFSVTTCESASAAMDLLKTKHYDAIISDYQMQGINGVEFLKSIRLHFGQVPFILFTGRGREDVVIEAINSGADFYLRKGGSPTVQFAELMHKVRQAVSRNKTELALIGSHAYLNRIFSSVKAGILIIDADTREILDINPAGTEIIGLPKEEITGHKCHTFICPAETGTCPITDLHSGIDNSERILTTSNGKTVPIIIYVTRINLDGRECLLKTFIDNRERKKAEENLVRKTGDLHAAVEKLTATEEELHHRYDLLIQKEQALRESEEKFRVLLDSSSDPIFSFYPDGTYRYVNRAFAEGVGKSVDQIIGRKIWDVFEKDEAEKRFSTLSAVFSTGEGKEFEVRVPRPDGDRYYVTTIVPIKDDNGSVVSAICSSKEITARRRIEDALRQANKKLNLLSGITRHDINNQLQVLNGFLEVLHSKIPDPALKKYFSRIMGASTGISAMIRFTEEYEKIGVRAPVWHDLQTLVKRAGTDVVLGPVVLKNDLPANNEVFADPLIVKVFFNLIDNTLRHGGTITTIRFSSETRNGDRIIVCEDDGDGVANEEKEKIFNRGFGKNTGFGLAISREILDITGITIRETGEPGRGARFEIAVPKGAYRIAAEQ